jgi:hypothetical protein
LGNNKGGKMELNEDEKRILKVLLKNELKRIETLDKKIVFEDGGEFASQTEYKVLMEGMLRRL